MVQPNSLSNGPKDGAERGGIDSTAFIVGAVIIAVAFVGTLFLIWAKAVGDKETCSEAIGSIRVRGSNLEVCNSLSWFGGAAAVTTLMMGYLSIRDFVHNPRIRRLPLYIPLLALSFAVYFVPTLSMGFTLGLFDIGR